MTEHEWLTATDPRDILHGPGWRERQHRRLSASEVPWYPVVNSERKFRLYACACFRLSFPRLNFRLDRIALEMAERHADGGVSDDGLTNAGVKCGLTARWLTQHPALLAARMAVGGTNYQADHPAGRQVELPDSVRCQLLRDIFGNPFRPVQVAPSWQTPTVLALASAIYDERAFDRMPVLADALEEAGCDDADVLGHCRGDSLHVRGCWVVDLLLGKS